METPRIVAVDEIHITLAEAQNYLPADRRWYHLQIVVASGKLHVYRLDDLHLRDLIEDATEALL